MKPKKPGFDKVTDFGVNWNFYNSIIIVIAAFLKGFSQIGEKNFTLCLETNTQKFS